MQSLIRLSGLMILGLALIVPSFAGDAKKPKKDADKQEVEKGTGDAKPVDPDEPEKKGKKTKKAKEAPKEKLAYGQYFVAKLTQMDANSQRDMTVQVKVSEPNPDGINRMTQLQQQLIQQQVQFAQARNFQGKQNALNSMRNTQMQMLQAQGNMIRYKDQDVRIRAADGMKVRWNYPPPDYDDKGNIKKYTKEELKALKGDEGLPGYKGEMESLRQGQILTVYMARKSPQIKGLKGVKGVQVGKKVADEEEGTLQDRPEAVMIVIMAEPKQQ